MTSTIRSVPTSNWRAVTNPFVATSNPKIPDGSTRISVGQKFQVVRQIQAPLDNELTLVVYPGLGTCIAYHEGTKDHWCIPNHSTHGTYKIATVDGVYDGAAPQHLFLQYANDTIAKWRMVSAGIRLSLVNNADENDGWWEAARIQHSTNPSDWCLYNTGGVDNIYYNTSGVGGAIVNDTVFFGPRVFQTPGAESRESIFGIDPKCLIEHPSYRTGKLRDIHKFTFNLKPNGTDHSWTKHRESFPVSTNGSVAEDTALGAGGSLIVSMPGDTGVSANHDEMIDRNTDANYDAIIIRIHGRSTVSKTTLLAHVCCNQEIVYENGTTLARFHSPGEKAKQNTTTRPKGVSLTMPRTPTGMLAWRRAKRRQKRNGRGRLGY